MINHILSFISIYPMIGMPFMRIDMDIQQTDKESGIRPVNILTIKYLIFDGVKYIVE